MVMKAKSETGCGRSPTVPCDLAALWLGLPRCIHVLGEAEGPPAGRQAGGLTAAVFPEASTASAWARRKTEVVSGTAERVALGARWPSTPRVNRLPARCVVSTPCAPFRDPFLVFRL